MRGLKQAESESVQVTPVASFTDAWIETKERNIIKLRNEVASFTDAWIETKRLVLSIAAVRCRIFYRCVD